jgi:hypothetical protein
MAEMEDRLLSEIKQFLEVYTFLSQEGKSQFEVQLGEHLKKTDGSTRKLYQSLLVSAREGIRPQEAVQRLQALRLAARP